MASDAAAVDGVEQYESINEFVIASEYGYIRFVGPFSVEKTGTRWTIMLPDDEEIPNVGMLSAAVGDAGVLIADGRAVGGGIFEEIDDPEGEDRLVAIVNQYAMGGRSVP